MAEYSAQKKKETAARLTTTFLTFLVVGYLLFLVGQAIVQNYQTNQRIKALTQEIENLNMEKENWETLNAYYQTDAYIELGARRQLGLKKPGETVVDVEVSGSPGPANLAQKEKKELKDQSSNLNKWYRYLFLGERKA